MDIEELRKQVIECQTIEEMRTVWETLKGMSECMYRPVFNYTNVRNLARDTAAWGATSHSSTIYYKDFMAEFGNPNIDKEILRRKIIGNFQSFDEMKEAQELLRSIDETVRTNSTTNQPLRFESSIKEWVCCNTFAANMTLQELKNFLQPKDLVKDDEKECHCKSLIHGHSLGCYYFKEL